MVRHITQPCWHRGFSLIELLLVIFIVSLVYFLGFSTVEKSEKKARAVTPLTLKTEIRDSSLFQGEGTLICINRCRTCYLRKDIASPFEKIAQPIALGTLQVYSVNHNNELYKHDFGRYQDSKICLLMDFYHNGSSSQLILQNSKGIYFLPSFFGSPQKVSSLEEAKEMWLSGTDMVKDQGDYY